MTFGERREENIKLRDYGEREPKERGKDYQRRDVRNTWDKLEFIITSHGRSYVNGKVTCEISTSESEDTEDDREHTTKYWGS